LETNAEMLGVGGEIQVKIFRFDPQTFGGVILLIESKLTPPNGNCAQDAAGIASENYTCMHMTLNFKRHINFLIRHIIY